MPKLCPTNAFNDILNLSAINLSIRAVLENFEYNSSNAQNIARLQKCERKDLIETLVFLDIECYGATLVPMKLKGVQKYIIAKLITAKITFHLPQRCNECNCDYIIPLNDDQKDLRKYCFTCSKPSHTCPTNIIAPETQKMQPLWICETCFPKHQSIFIQYLQNDDPSTNLANPTSTPPQQTDADDSTETPPSQDPTNLTNPNDLQVSGQGTGQGVKEGPISLEKTPVLSSTPIQASSSKLSHPPTSPSPSLPLPSAPPLPVSPASTSSSLPTPYLPPIPLLLLHLFLPEPRKIQRKTNTKHMFALLNRRLKEVFSYFFTSFFP